jgi:hypothetical protein
VGWPQFVAIVPKLAAIGLIWFLVGLALLLALASLAFSGHLILWYFRLLFGW